MLARLLSFWRGWRPVASDPPPLGVKVLGLCDYTGVRSVTARRDDIYFRRWDSWYTNHPTHWMHLPASLPRAQEPPAMAPLYDSSNKR